MGLAYCIYYLLSNLLFVLCYHGDIPKNLKVKGEQTCLREHFGICKCNDALMYRHMTMLARAMYMNVNEQGWYFVQSLAGPVLLDEILVVVAQKRPKDPQVAMFFHCDLDDITINVQTHCPKQLRYIKSSNQHQLSKLVHRQAIVSVALQSADVVKAPGPITRFTLVARVGDPLEIYVKGKKLHVDSKPKKQKLNAEDDAMGEMMRKGMESLQAKSFTPYGGDFHEVASSESDASSSSDASLASTVIGDLLGVEVPDLMADEDDLMAADSVADDLMMADDLMAPPPHVFWWLSRTNRQAKCFACQKMIPGQSYRAIYEPDKAAVKNLKVWSTVFWKYFHINSECLKHPMLVAPLPPADEIRYEVSELPKAAKESAEMRDASRRAALHDLIVAYTRAKGAGAGASSSSAG